MCIEGYRIQKKDSSEMMMQVDDILPFYMETQYKNRISYMYFSRIRITGIRKKCIQWNQNIATYTIEDEQHANQNLQKKAFHVNIYH